MPCSCLLLTETPVRKRPPACPWLSAWALGAFVAFALLLFVVTRLNPDR